MANKIDESAIMRTIDWTYDKAINGLPGLSTAQELGNEYMADKGSLCDRVNRLIRWQNTKSATSGFITGLGGIITLPATIPANLASVLYVQLRMVAAIAYMGGHDIRSDRVRTLAYTCLVGDAAVDIIKECGIAAGKKFTLAAIKKIPGKVLTKINQKVGFRLLTKFGQKGLINLWKAVPILGGLIGGTFDLVATNAIGNIARNTFITDEG